jgi:ribonucleoside-diphosphate reductase alpha chain
MWSPIKVNNPQAKGKIAVLEVSRNVDSGLMVIKRNGEVVGFDASRVRNAIQKAMMATGRSVNSSIIDEMVHQISDEIHRRFTTFYPNVENVQDIVEKHLMNHGLYEVAKAYILYRAKRQEERAQAQQENIQKSLLGKLKVIKRSGKQVLFDIRKVQQTIVRAAEGYQNQVSGDLIFNEAIKNIYDGVHTEEIEKALVLAASSLIEKDPAYSWVAARFFLERIIRDVVGKAVTHENLEKMYRKTFKKGIEEGVALGQLNPKMLEFDLETLADHLVVERDGLFGYLGLHTLTERYFLRSDLRLIELPQAFWMRVSMGLCLEEKDKTGKVLEFYDVMSTFHYIPSTPTLFHSGTQHPQLSSCYLTTVSDDLKHIFKSLSDNAQLSKWSGGLGNDWSNVRATGAWIKTTKVESQGVIPFLKIANDVTMAINRSGKRRGATCAYLETWHLDIEDFLDLRRNTGDDRRRTHDMNTANWIPDLFVKRVVSDSEWTLFSPDEVPDLHHAYGQKFERKYEVYENLAKEGKIKKFKTVSATKLWRKMLSRLFETGHPWITFKDPCNVRSPQDHVGTVHSSNLCTEITLNTSETETAVCNLGSINLERHVVDGKLDKNKLAKTIESAVRMLDNVVDINYYPTEEAKHSNLQHRPVGLGLMGFQDALYKLDLAFSSEAAIEFSDEVMEFVSYHAILTSSRLAKERGRYPSYVGSKWDRALFPLDTVDLLEQERGVPVEVSRTRRLDWSEVRDHVKKYGMRNSNTMAIAPTATISNIVGCYPCIEPIYKNIYVKSNISGEFTIVNHYLVDDLKRLGLWDEDMLQQIKYYDGNIQAIDGIPDCLKAKYREAFEIDPLHCIKMSAVRAKWIDQSQSHNVFMKGASGKLLSDIYLTAWKCGLKTTYYLRTLAATQVEKSTLDASKFGYTQKREYRTPAESKHSAASSSSDAALRKGSESEIPLCRIEDPDCEACQ